MFLLLKLLFTKIPIDLLLLRFITLNFIIGSL